MAGSNTAPKLTIEDEGDKIKLTLTKPKRSIPQDPKIQAQLLRQERNQGANNLRSTAMDDLSAKNKERTSFMDMDENELKNYNEDLVKNYKPADGKLAGPVGGNDQKNDGGGNIPAEDYGNIGGEEDGQRSPDVHKNESQNSESETENSQNPDENNNAKKGKNDDTESPGDVNSEKQQARNEAALESGGDDNSLNKESPENEKPGSENQETNPNSKIEKDRNLAKAEATQAENIAVNAVKKAGWSAAKKWLWGVIISAIVSILPYIIGLGCLIIFTLIVYQLFKHPTWSFIDIWLGRYGDLVKIIFTL